MNFLISNLILVILFTACQSKVDSSGVIEESSSPTNQSENISPLEEFRWLRDRNDLDSIDELLEFCEKDQSSTNCDQALDHLWMKLPQADGWSSSDQKLYQKMKSQEVVAKISALAKSSNPLIKINVINILVSIKSDNLKEILQILINDRNQLVRKKAQKALTSLDN